MSEPVVLCAVGDVFVDRSDPSTAFAGVQDIFGAADVRFGNNEAVYSDTQERHPAATAWIISEPRNFVAVRDARFDAMSCANNHIMDGGYSGLSDTLELLRDAGIVPVGAGADFGEASQPAVVKAGSVRFGFLAYTCVYPPGSEAKSSRAGCAALTIRTTYENELGQPGTRPLVFTFVDRSDKERALEEIARARAQVDFLLVSVHWGIHNVQAELTDYERELGRAAVDAGADLVVGHHQHILKGVEVHRGKPIFYGLGNFIFDFRPKEGFESLRESMKGFHDFYGAHAPGASTDSLFHPDSRKTMLVRCIVSSDGLAQAEIVPCLLNDAGTPLPLVSPSAEFDAYLAYLELITAEAELNGRFAVQDSRIRVVLEPA